MDNLTVPNSFLEVNTTWTNSSMPFQLTEKPLPLAVALTFSGVGILTNISLILAVTRDRSSGISTRILLINLSVCGVLIFVTILPPSAVISYLPTKYQTPLGVSCSLYAAVQLAITAFSFTDFFLSINRFVAICIPHYYTHFQSPKLSLAMVALSWIIPAILVACTAAGIGVRYIQQPDMFCDSVPLNTAGKFSVLVMGVFPYSMVGLLSTIIFAVAFVKHRQLAPSSSGAARYHFRLMKKRLLVAKAMALMLIWDIVVCVPYVVVPIVSPTFSHRYPNLWELVRLLPFTEYTCSPLIFLGMSSAYRLALLQQRRCAHRIVFHPSGTAFDNSHSKGGIPSDARPTQQVTSFRMNRITSS